jgi:hypothetical protein
MQGQLVILLPGQVDKSDLFFSATLLILPVSRAKELVL